jgi:hypothetical protein
LIRPQIYFLFSLLFISISIQSLKAQAQTGIYVGTNLLSLSTKEINSKSALGFDLGFQFITGIHRTGDLFTEIGYSSNSIKLEGNLNNETDFFKFHVQNVNVNFLYNRYLKLPESNKPHIGLQAGISFSILNQWRLKDEEEANYTFGETDYSFFDIQELRPINTHIVGGIEIGFEQYRLNLRYYKTITNPLRQGGDLEEDIGGDSLPHTIALSFTYFWDKFY